MPPGNSGGFLFVSSFVLSYFDGLIRLKSVCADSEIGATGWRTIAMPARAPRYSTIIAFKKHGISFVILGDH